MNILSYLTRPRLPRAAFILEAGEAAAVELGRNGRKFQLTGAARIALGPDLFTPAFKGTNVPDRDALAEVLNSVVDAAGLGRRTRWSIVLPETAVQTFMLTFDSAPNTRDELREMIGWKVERLVGVSTDELKISQQYVGAGQVPRFLAIVMRRDVLAEYEDLFAVLGWQTGVIVPRFIGEAAWLDWDRSPGDKLMVGGRGETCQVALVRDGDLLFVRTIDGEPDRFDDEIYRFTMYYRDRIAESPESAVVRSVLAHGQVDGWQLLEAVSKTLGSEPFLVRPIPDLLEADEASMSPTLVAAAGLATQAWSPA